MLEECCLLPMKFQKRDDRDGRDDLCGTHFGIKKAVTVVTAVTGKGIYRS